MLLLSMILFSIIIPEDLMQDSTKLHTLFAGLIFTILIIPPYLIKMDLSDGFLESLLSIANPRQVIMAKFLSLTISLMMSIILIAPIIYLFFQIELFPFLYIYAIMILTIFQISILLIFINLIHAYFKQNTNFLIALILPIIIPSFMIASLGLNSLNLDFIMIMLGIDLIFIPSTFYLASYLLEHLFDF